MRIIVNREVLQGCLAQVAHAIKEKSPRAQLLCVQLEADRPLMGTASLVVTGSDGELTIQARVHSADVQVPGSVVIPHHKLAGILMASGSPTVTIEAEADTARVTGDRDNYKLFGYPAAEGPAAGVAWLAPTKRNPEGTMALAAGQLGTMLERTIFALRSEAYQGFATDALDFEVSPDGLVLMGSDGRQMAIVQSDVGKGGEASAHLLLPRRTANAVRLALDSKQPDEPVRFQWTKDRVAFDIGEAPHMPRLCITSNLVEGKPAPWRQVVPASLGRHIQLKTEVLLSAVRRAAIFKGEHANATLHFHSIGVDLIASNHLGECVVQLREVETRGEFETDFRVGISIKHFLGVLGALGTEKVLVYFGPGLSSPMVVHGPPGYTFVTTPMHDNGAGAKHAPRPAAEPVAAGA